MDTGAWIGAVCCAALHHPRDSSFVAKALRISRDAHLDENVQKNVGGKCRATFSVHAYPVYTLWCML